MAACVYFLVCILFLQYVYTSSLYGGGVCILSPCVYFFSNGYISGCVYVVPLWWRVYTFSVCILFLQRLH